MGAIFAEVAAPDPIEIVLFDLGGVLLEVGGVAPMRELSGIDTDELSQSLGTRHETNHVIRRVVCIDHERAASRHAAHVIPALDHRSLNQHNDVGVLIFVGEFVLENTVAHAAVFTRGRVGAVGIVDIVLHRLRVLAFDAGGGGDGIDNVATLFVHNDAARPNGKFGVTHDQTSFIT